MEQKHGMPEKKRRFCVCTTAISANRKQKFSLQHWRFSPVTGFEPVEKQVGSEGRPSG